MTNKNIAWEDIEPLILDEKYKEFFKNINTETFHMVLDESKHDKVLESILQMLKTVEYSNGIQI